MAYHVLLVPAYTGHINPMTVLGRELQRRGHRIVVIARLAAEVAVHKAGLEFLPVATVEFPVGEWERRTARIDRKSTRLNSSHPRLSRMPSSA